MPLIGAAKRLEVAFYGIAAMQRVVGRMVGRYLHEIAADKAGHLDALSSVRHIPAVRLDLSPAPFSKIARAAGVVPVGAVFSPLAGEMELLLAAHMVEQSCAGVYRCAGGTSGRGGDIVAALVADATYHAGLVHNVLLARGVGGAAERVAAVVQRLARQGAAAESETRHAVNGLLLGDGPRGRGGFFPDGLAWRALRCP